jgi:hypothetical protein
LLVSPDRKLKGYIVFNHFKVLFIADLVPVDSILMFLMDLHHSFIDPFLLEFGIEVVMFWLYDESFIASPVVLVWTQLTDLDLMGKRAAWRVIEVFGFEFGKMAGIFKS